MALWYIKVEKHSSKKKIVLLKNRAHGFPMFTNLCITFVFTLMLNMGFYILPNIF